LRAAKSTAAKAKRASRGIDLFLPSYFTRVIAPEYHAKAKDNLKSSLKRPGPGASGPKGPNKSIPYVAVPSAMLGTSSPATHKSFGPTLQRPDALRGEK